MAKYVTGKNVIGNVEIEGLDELKYKLERLGVDVQATLQAVMMEAADAIRVPAKVMAPGPEIEKEPHREGKHHVEVWIGPDKDKWYYRFFELGTQNPRRAPHDRVMRFWGGEGYVFTYKTAGISQQPFLRPAFDNNKDKAVQEVGNGVRLVIMKQVISA